jgi:hypothetical protein
VTEESVHSADSVEKLKADFDKISEEFYDLLKKHKFYLGDAIFNTFFELYRGIYIINVTQKADIWDRNQGESARIDIDEAKNHIKRYKINIVHVRELFLSGDI